MSMSYNCLNNIVADLNLNKSKKICETFITIVDDLTSKNYEKMSGASELCLVFKSIGTCLCLAG